MSYGNVMDGWKVGELEEGDVMVVEESLENGGVDEKCVKDSRFKGLNGNYETDVEANINGNVGEKEKLSNDKSELKSMFFRSNKYCMNLFKNFIDEKKGFFS